MPDISALCTKSCARPLLQTEKQRIIWAYKILFLDVLFPLSLRKVIFMDSDQIIRTDVSELWHMDLQVGSAASYCGPCMIIWLCTRVNAWQNRMHIIVTIPQAAKMHPALQLRRGVPIFCAKREPACTMWIAARVCGCCFGSAMYGVCTGRAV